MRSWTNIKGVALAAVACFALPYSASASTVTINVGNTGVELVCSDQPTCDALKGFVYLIEGVAQDTVAVGSVAGPQDQIPGKVAAALDLGNPDNTVALSSTFASTFSVSPDNLTVETAILSELVTALTGVDTTFSSAQAVKDDDATNTFNVAAGYTVVKAGGFSAFFENTLSTTLIVNWMGSPDVSHVTGVFQLRPDPEISPIPLPAAGWLLLGGLGALGAAARRKRKAA